MTTGNDIYTYEYSWVGTDLQGNTITKRPGDIIYCGVNIGTMTFTPVITKEYKEYTVHVIDSVTESEYKTLTVHYGDVITMDMLEPGEMIQTISTNYIFTGFDVSLPYTVTSTTDDITLTAQYRAEKRSYTISFDAGQGEFADGSKIKRITVPYGDSFNFSDYPELEMDGTTYTFSAWSPEVSYIAHGYAVYRAVYDAGVSFTLNEFADIIKDSTYPYTSGCYYLFEDYQYYVGTEPVGSEYTLIGQITDKVTNISMKGTIKKIDIATGAVTTKQYSTDNIKLEFYNNDVKNEFVSRCNAAGISVQVNNEYFDFAPSDEYTGWTGFGCYTVKLKGLSYRVLNIVNQMKMENYYICTMAYVTLNSSLGLN